MPPPPSLMVPKYPSLNRVNEIEEHLEGNCHVTKTLSSPGGKLLYRYHEDETYGSIF